ncbi:helix-turn-helix domain-containing protein [Prevotella sp. E13-27]|uniref:helix-turn-helix domain-containing protein n=1 Tax=Prevotella sp. E13-27 TaxID=2938122 RepID=UPI00200AAC84|nr:helix-turn-helix transcriptional regulator [Prevotella sp. E13-27]MCK8622604.1 helix-turn-helix domain-containing protein [Prevotella sp. E13-27]
MANFQIIRDLCEKKKISIRKLADMVDMKDGSIHNLINTGSTNTATLEAIAKALDVSPAIFWEPVDVTDKEKEILHLKELLAEKERTIKILLERQK